EPAALEPQHDLAVLVGHRAVADAGFGGNRAQQDALAVDLVGEVAHDQGVPHCPVDDVAGQHTVQHGGVRYLANYGQPIGVPGVAAATRAARRLRQEPSQDDQLVQLGQLV